MKEEKKTKKQLIDELESLRREVADLKRCERSEREYRGLFENAHDAILILDPDGERVLDVNDRACRMYGFSRSEFLGMSLEPISKDVALGKLRVEETLEREANVNFETVQRRKDGTEMFLEVNAAVVEYKGKRAILSINRDITERKRAEERLLHDTLHDLVTGLPNRALFMDRLGVCVVHSKRRKDYIFAVLFLDLDRFKVVNDSLGHLIGDQLLIGMARRLEGFLRPGDTTARFGGDEFAVLLDDIKDLSDATRVAERIRTGLEQPFNLNGQEVFASASIGINVVTSNYDTPEDVLRDSDTAMYRAKALGKARHEIFDQEMHGFVVELLQLETDLRRAIERSEFLIHYQPIVSLKSGSIMGFEALVRWQHPQRGLIPPVKFISLAEETGLIIPIGYWVLRQACSQMRAWHDEYPRNPPLTISVNLSAKQFAQPDLIRQIEVILQETGLDPRCLRLEITEGVVMQNADSTIQMLLQLRALNVQLHIDDFGTGYSSFSYLYRFPIQSLKIDRSFISRMGIGDENSEIVRTIVNLARNLGMEVIAEGIETTEQLALLNELQCECGQGFHFSQPVDCAAAGSLIAGRE
jgi:diguanylate cyclase (GGDEF)-like protein/PAS domain S-box-containing protein